MALTEQGVKPESAGINRRIDNFRTNATGPYNITQRVYPLEISTDVAMQHYATFYINVRGKSDFYKNNANKVVGEVTSAGENRVDSRELGKATGAAFGIGAGAVAGMAIGKTIGQGVYARATSAGRGTKTAGALGGLATVGTVVGTAAAAGVAGAYAGDFLIKPDTSYRISDAITLHISNAPQVQYSADYDNVELGTLIGGIASGLSATDATRMAMLPEAVRATFLKAAGGIGNLVSAQSIGNGIGVGSKQNLNPFREVLFQSVGFRRFTFDYVFMPRNKQESENVWNIIQTFKYHMHPELTEGGLYYIHPSEFNIQYYFNGKENQYFNKISTCVLEDVEVDFGGEAFSSFKDGAPVEVKMRLRFREIETLTKERIKEGF